MSHFHAERYGPGETATDFKPGDFILTHRHHPVSRMIRLAQKGPRPGAEVLLLEPRGRSRT